jgi:hypothetical protein
MPKNSILFTPLSKTSLHQIYHEVIWPKPLQYSSLVDIAKDPSDWHYLTGFSEQISA